MDKNINRREFLQKLGIGAGTALAAMAMEPLQVLAGDRRATYGVAEGDAKKQEEYLREMMADAPARYLKEKIPNKEDLQLTLGEYDADKECFPVSLDIAPWNIFMLPVPLAEAKDFKNEFDSIKAAAIKTAKIGIHYDAPSIEAITFTTHSGKVYQ